MIKVPYSVKLPSGDRYSFIKNTLKSRTLYTVCEEAHCPNMGECWESGTATFMILGSNCSRGCRFCAVTHGKMLPIDPDEPQKVYEAVKLMRLDFVVITSVDRDDLPDKGSQAFANVISKLKTANVKIEVLIPDFSGIHEFIDKIINAAPDVIAHNIETVRRLTPHVRDPRAGYDQSLNVLKYVKSVNKKMITKSSIMIGLGETDEEVIEAMKDLRNAGVNILTVGQYLRPTKKQLEVVEYSPIERFKYFEESGYKMGFDYVASGPLVRTSYRAAEAYVKGMLNGGGNYD
ncbi:MULTISPECIES: lipoyl synthase [unclassified Acidiplasma]|uniref:lipoyl synthase n=1 Tax=unclassified Acidiplasma TaxID=2641301 RepID=UPI0005E2A47B|nr:MULTISPECIES: lipoyl synthase [unclassified Acidiplasma]KJE48891.1 radical SAM protein [Acidiplasma sp. MBA-1]WMT54296.1 MAG: lipoyl synthase [Acidiplasma sp.]